MTTAFRPPQKETAFAQISRYFPKGTGANRMGRKNRFDYLRLLSGGRSPDRHPAVSMIRPPYVASISSGVC